MESTARPRSATFFLYCLIVERESHDFMGSDAGELRNVHEHIDVLQKSTASTTGNMFLLLEN